MMTSERLGVLPVGLTYPFIWPLTENILLTAPRRYFVFLHPPLPKPCDELS